MFELSFERKMFELLFQSKVIIGDEREPETVLLLHLGQKSSRESVASAIDLGLLGEGS